MCSDRGTRRRPRFRTWPRRRRFQLCPASTVLARLPWPPGRERHAGAGGHEPVERPRDAAADRREGRAGVVLTPRWCRSRRPPRPAVGEAKAAAKTLWLEGDTSVPVSPPSVVRIRRVPSAVESRQVRGHAAHRGQRGRRWRRSGAWGSRCRRRRSVAVEQIAVAHGVAGVGVGEPDRVERAGGGPPGSR